MAQAQSYIDLLSERIGIAPANSQEELQAAQEVAEQFAAHGLEPELQEFDAPAMGTRIYGFVLVALFVGVLLSGIGGVVGVIGSLLALAACALGVCRVLGMDPLSAVNGKARSQNVIGVHHAAGPLVAKGSRPIVVVAHYDTPREEILANPSLARYRSTIIQASQVCVPVVALLAFLQLFGFLPGVTLRIFWVLGIIASLPPLLWGVSLVAGLFMPYTQGANDNKASVAVMLDVLDHVCPTSSSRPVDDGQAPALSLVADGEAGGTGQMEAQPREGDSTQQIAPIVPSARRHGEAVLRGLGILPDGCAITYVAPERPQRLAPERPAAPVAPAADQDSRLAPADQAEETEATTPVSAEAGDAPVAAPGATAPMDVAAVASAAPAPEDGATQPMDLSGVAGAREAAPVLREGAPSAAPAPAPVDDPTWGTTTFRPAGENVARRAVLFDLPDPSVATIDPFAVDNAADLTTPVAMPRPSRPASSSLGDTASSAPAPVAYRSQPTPLTQYRPQGAAVAAPASAPAQQEAAPAPEDIRVIAPESIETMRSAVPEADKDKHHRFHFGRKKKKEEESMSQWLGVDEGYDAKRSGGEIGSWDNFDEDDMWKGGAARASFLRGLRGGAAAGDAEQGDAPVAEDPTTPAAPLDPALVSERLTEEAFPETVLPVSDPAKQAPMDRELRDAITKMGDDALVAHDIWFVALGASELDHAGMKAFLDKYRKNVRGCFVINLWCVGSGVPSVLTKEGFVAPRKADRRLGTLLTSTADALHCPLAKATIGWGDTDATPAMRASLRSVTIAGLDDGQVPALSHTKEDVRQAIDDRQLRDITALVCEAIRRS